MKISKRTKIIGKIAAATAIGAGVIGVINYQSDIINRLSNKVIDWRDKAADNYESLVELKSAVIDKIGDKSFSEIADKLSNTSLPFQCKYSFEK